VDTHAFECVNIQARQRTRAHVYGYVSIYIGVSIYIFTFSSACVGDTFGILIRCKFLLLIAKWYKNWLHVILRINNAHIIAS